MPRTAILHADGLYRCPWPGTDPLYVAYHDEEWGVPEYDGRALFEKLILDGFQAGLSWITILRKRDRFREAFDGFDPARIARYGEKKVEALMGDAGIVRNRGKIVGTIEGAKAWLALEEGRGFSRYLWDRSTAGRCGIAFAAWRRSRRRRPLSQAISKDLRRAASASSGRPSSMPSCRRSAWSTTISSTAIATTPARARPRAGIRAEHGRAGAERSRRAWQRMLSGRRLDLLDPSPLDIEIEDIAHGLARVARWNGQTKGAPSSRSPSIRCWSPTWPTPWHQERTKRRG